MRTRGFDTSICSQMTCDAYAWYARARVCTVPKFAHLWWDVCYVRCEIAPCIAPSSLGGEADALARLASVPAGHRRRLPDSGVRRRRLGHPARSRPRRPFRPPSLAGRLGRPADPSSHLFCTPPPTPLSLPHLFPLAPPLLDLRSPHRIQLPLWRKSGEGPLCSARARGAMYLY